MEYLKAKGYGGLSVVRSEEDLTVEGRLPHPIRMGRERQRAGRDGARGGSPEG
jgi:hypothetical protein